MLGSTNTKRSRVLVWTLARETWCSIAEHKSTIMAKFLTIVLVVHTKQERRKYLSW